MSKLVDDLLQEVEQLEASTQAMDSDVQQLEQQQKTLNDSALTVQNTLLFEATKITQEAAKHSHSAATNSIKLSEQLKARNTELDELSSNWRQAVRNTLREQQTAKKYFAVMMGATIAVCLISISAIGYLVFLLNQQGAQHKGEVLDIIQTESQLLSNKLIVKTDELASLTEAMSVDVKRLRNLNLNRLDQNEQNTPRSTTASNTPKADVITSQTSPSRLTIEQLTAQHEELKALIQKILTQTKVPPKTVKNISTTKPHKTDPAQLKKLNDLSWLIRKQDKALKAIQNTLAGKLATPSNNKQLQKTLEALKIELSLLNQQQTKVQLQLKTLQDGLSKHLKKPAEKPPYSYKSTTDYKLD